MQKGDTVAGEKGKVINERTVLSVFCPNCRVRGQRLCIDPRGAPLQKAHPERYLFAYELLTDRVNGKLSATDKALISYYAFIMLCDSVSVRSKEVLGIEMTTEQIQAGFCRKAIEALQEDGLLPVPPKGANGKTH